LKTIDVNAKDIEILDSITADIHIIGVNSDLFLPEKKTDKRMLH
jgi:hypothetical protein